MCGCSYLASWEAAWYCIWNFWKDLINIQNENYCSCIYEYEYMKMNALSCMNIYLPCFLVNFTATIYKILFGQNVEHLEHVGPTIIYIIKRFHLDTTGVCSSTRNPLNCNKHAVVKSFKIVVNFYRYQVNQCLLANILNRQQSKKSFEMYLCCSSVCLKAYKTFSYK